MKLQPLAFLRKRGRDIFYELVDSCNKKSGVVIDSYQLSMLASQIELYEKAVKAVYKNNGVHTTPNDYKQVSAEFTVMQNTLKQINSLGKKFGINPLDRGVLKKSSPSEESDPAQLDMFKM